MNLLGIKKINQESLRLVDSSSDLNENDNGEHNNLELIEDQNQIDNAASEIVRLSKLDENLKIFDTIRSNDDDESNSEGKNNQPTFINPTEKELEEEIFRNNNLPDVYQILSIRRSHDAYSRSDRIRGIRQQPGINLNIGSNDNVDRNTANHLITQLNSNDLNRQTVNNRTNRCCANVFQNNPLEKDGFLIIFSDQKLYIRIVITIYENISGRHEYISRNITNIDAISYISLVSLFIDVYNGSFFTNNCQIGGKLFAHIIPKEVIYYFEKPDTITFQNNSILTLNEEALRIYNFFNNSNARK
ncbi:hypothetical protein GLOIN_2v1766725 [Rhizophagus irregularis DAOM 181602=DAOM 197198]|uniref:Uncharacterized protein n=1 Tax=Rhizophagus irregularis (strain DAOM 181602 / DAOM 197198 / MUCL 43194) TaxID=747089 RepID=A0A2P4QLL2_RHIID|nr:hypothetical protein GLOIN_2v1766725 [Rhizophagus irregularis DAOM 181602=DAOM 197198]POG78532.1 hypothetical protein GLOIN_2v1766725 [Rhizophagus irregularis DAOM 181602=DAOM 197198]|eukprot:XP_025185398.1 hypothetical protein GLOIN_2v1766725 [Rhizophagus irregularis DAOM 181602=DAOM 197198]